MELYLFNKFGIGDPFGFYGAAQRSLGTSSSGLKLFRVPRGFETYSPDARYGRHTATLLKRRSLNELHT